MDEEIRSLRFKGLNPKPSSKGSKTLVMSRVSKDNKKIIVKNYGRLDKLGKVYYVRLNRNYVIFLPKEKISKRSSSEYEMLLDKNTWKVSRLINERYFDEDDDKLNFSYWLEVAKEQEERGEKVKWK